MDQLIDNLNNLELEEKGYVTLSQKNKTQLFFKGHFFRLKNPKQDLNVLKKFGWRCTSQSCCATCETYSCVVGSSYEILKFNGQHIEASKTNFSQKEYRCKIKELSLVSEENPRKIIAKAKSEVILNEEEAASASSYDADRQAILRVKNSVQPNYPPQPNHLHEIDFPEFLKKTLAKSEEEAKEFILFDSGKEEKDRFFIFGTREQLELIDNGHIFCLEKIKRFMYKNFIAIYFLLYLFICFLYRARAPSE